jgi:hypothetical protein
MVSRHNITLCVRSALVYFMFSHKRASATGRTFLLRGKRILITIDKFKCMSTVVLSFLSNFT